MPVQFLLSADQPDGQFNNGGILEKRPVVLSRGNKGFRPYSNLFYWANAWSENGSTIGEHPHQGFEILSFVMKGEIEHYDSAYKKWIKLKAGDVQIIRSGSGISHSEKILPGSQMFQIWFDPDLDKTIKKKASYNDYASEIFPLEKENGLAIKILKGKNSPLLMDTPGIEIKEISFDDGNHNLALEGSEVYSIFIVEGILKINHRQLLQDDFMKIEGENSIRFDTSGNAKIFMIQSPSNPGYPTYATGRN